MKKLTLLFLLLSAAGALLADTIQVDLVSPSQTGAPGDLLQFFGTITNLSATDTIYFNSGSGTATSPDLTFDMIPFFFNKPPFLAPGDTSPLFEIFDIAIDPAATPGPDIGNTVAFQGGADSGTFDDLGGVSVDVLVTSAPSTAAPEPSTAGLLGIGATLLVGLRWRRRWMVY